ncbi:MAG: hypothetical protein DYG94_07725 [Leptolyngbya sp. PLA3]|nr:MAG: hypothetical protein EDM82_10370 [Cyanobacteria bacterium CYA]MCE7968619.1 hypothetical protein [Leptolyngbya sp. PL-A3]
MSRLISGTVLLAALASMASANPVSGTYFDTNHCDNQGARQAVDELGTFIFPLNELIDASSTPTNISACVAHDNPNMLNYRVRMTNLTGQSWTDLFYVADLGTSISNEDGMAWSTAAPGAVGQAFRIDAAGVNHNLISESINANGVFEVGEVWEFIIQDFVSAWGGPAHAFDSLDFAGGSSMVPGSTGSIVQMLVPSPGVLAMMGLGGAISVRRRR